MAPDPVVTPTAVEETQEIGLADVAPVAGIFGLIVLGVLGVRWELKRRKEKAAAKEKELADLKAELSSLRTRLASYEDLVGASAEASPQA